MNYFVVGGEFNNKGAEAMTLVCLRRILKNDPKSCVYFLDSRTSNHFPLIDNIKYFYDLRFLIECLNFRNLKLKRRIKITLIAFQNYKSSVSALRKDYLKFLSSIDVMIDISGYQLGTKWGKNTANSYCDRIDAVKSSGGKVFLMPQSFGPFDFDSETLSKIKNSLSKCDTIFAREKKGYDELCRFGLANVKLMHDSVLTETDEAYRSVVKDYEKYIEDIDVINDKSIAIIPNYRLIDKGGYSKEKLIELYCRIIQDNNDYDFYLVSHAGEDIELCKAVKDSFMDDGRVHFIDHVLYSFNYQKLAAKMKFIIASRYHAIVHAYKECTPALILGWSDKYEDLADLFEQTHNIIDFDDSDAVLKQIEMMKNNYDNDSSIIKKHLEEVQKEDCYHFLESIN